MEAEGAVMDVELESGQGSGGDGGQGEGQGGNEQQGQEGQGGGQQQDNDPYSPKSSREYSQWLKGLRDGDPATNGKFARIAKDDHSRLYQLHQMEPRGIDGVREKYALLDSIMHGDLKGPEAIGAIQDQLREVAEVDELLAAGDPRALEALGDDFNEGLAKLAPSILDRVRESDPEAYAAAILPHFVQALAQSDLVRNFNGLVDTLNEQMPAWLPEDKKAAWTADKMQRVLGLVGGMGQWLNTQAENAKKGPQANGERNGGRQGNRQQGADRGQSREHQAEQQLQDAHWKSNIAPKTDDYAKQKFTELFRPFAKRLRLDQPATMALRQAFVQGVVKKAMANKPYMDQMGRYHKQRNPDPGTVTNFFKVEFDKHAKSVMESLVNERYKPFLNGKPQNSQQQNQRSNGQQQRKAAPVSPGVTIVSVKPAMKDIDHKNTPLDWLHQKKYRLTNGKVVQVRA